MITDFGSDIPRIAAALAASLIAVDGVIDEEEKEMAVEMGRRMLPGFSQVAFDEILERLEELPSAYELAESLSADLDAEDKDRIIDYLVAIATADEVIVEGEEHELQGVADALGVPLPPLKVARPGT